MLDTRRGKIRFTEFDILPKYDFRIDRKREISMVAT